MAACARDVSVASSGLRTLSCLLSHLNFVLWLKFILVWNGMNNYDLVSPPTRVLTLHFLRREVSRRDQRNVHRIIVRPACLHCCCNYDVHALPLFLKLPVRYASIQSDRAQQPPPVCNNPLIMTLIMTNSVAHHTSKHMQTYPLPTAPMLTLAGVLSSLLYFRVLRPRVACRRASCWLYRSRMTRYTYAECLSPSCCTGRPPAPEGSSHNQRKHPQQKKGEIPRHHNLLKAQGNICVIRAKGAEPKV